MYFFFARSLAKKEITSPCAQDCARPDMQQLNQVNVPIIIKRKVYFFFARSLAKKEITSPCAQDCARPDMQQLDKVYVPIIIECRESERCIFFARSLRSLAKKEIISP